MYARIFYYKRFVHITITCCKLLGESVYMFVWRLIRHLTVLRLCIYIQVYISSEQKADEYVVIMLYYLYISALTA